ncbi:LL-diaminopimelate aminotransferase [Kribbella sp. NPDC049227]|uniref:LL-diaminopimelate aminotransferase n=1 Tax=Kribbella sp. NPDC049227 TaxID=3364113 RepID=UPI003712EC3B
MLPTKATKAMDVPKSKRLLELPPFLFMETRRRIGEAQARGVDVISLGIGDPDGPTPVHIVDALARAATDPANHKYPPGSSRGMTAFREAVAGWYDRRFGVQLDPGNEVLALIGSKEANVHLALGLLNPGDLAIVPDPGYPAYESGAILAGAQTLRMPLRAQNGFLPVFDAMLSLDVSASKVVWLSYPNNPTTAVAPLAFFRRAVEFAHRHGVLLVNDNPYSEISFDGVRVPSILEVDGAKEVAIEFSSLSKTYSMAGWRLGMAAGNKSALAAIRQVKENTDVGPFPAVQLAGVAALEGPQTAVAQQNAVYQQRRDRVIETLRGIGLTADPPKATFYVWAKLPDNVRSTEFAAALLEATGVVVTPGIGYGSQGEGYIRISLATPDDRLDEAMHRIKESAGRLPLQPVV